jgi:hypothetical protein
MNQAQFDEFTRALATGMSRRQVLKILVGGMLFPFLRKIDPQSPSPSWRGYGHGSIHTALSPAVAVGCMAAELDYGKCIYEADQKLEKCSAEITKKDLSYNPLDYLNKVKDQIECIRLYRKEADKCARFCPEGTNCSFCAGDSTSAGVCCPKGSCGCGGACCAKDGHECRPLEAVKECTHAPCPNLPVVCCPQKCLFTPPTGGPYCTRACYCPGGAGCA